MERLAHPLHRVLLGIVAALLIVTVAGMVVLWPRAADLPDPGPPPEELVAAEVVGIEVVGAEPDPMTGRSGELADITVELLDGPDAGEVLVLAAIPLDGYPSFTPGDRLALAPADIPDSDLRYFITDFQRLPTLGWLLALFVIAVLAIGRWHGLRSLIGLALSLVLIVRFVVPAIIAGSSPPLVALVGALAVMIITLYLAHGVNEMTTSAIIGTSAALVVTVGLGLLFISRGKITGFASDDAVFARTAVEGLDLQGLVLAGLIIAALGVLDDVTISQSSTVFALHDTDRQLTWSALFARAMKVGRDHIASVVNTLFLAYAGASIALLLLFTTSGLPTSELVNAEVMAEEIIKTVVGSLGLIAAVPFTTALAAAVAVRRPADTPPLGHGHGHGHGYGGIGQRASAGTAPTGRPTAGSDPPEGGRSAPAPAAGPDPDELAWQRYLAERPRGRPGALERDDEG